VRLTLSIPIVTLAVLVCACSGNGGSDGGSTGGTKTSSKNNSSSSTSGGSGNTVGETCDAEEHCQAGLMCETEIPLGYCTAACDPSTPGTCPADSTCIEALPGQFACGLACTVAAGCSRGGFSCDPTCLVCIPTITVGNISCPPSFAGTGNHLPDGGACGSLPTATGDLTWSGSVDISGSAATVAEFEGSGVAVAGDAGLIVVTYMEIGDAGQTTQIGVSVSNDDGQTFAVEPPLTATPVGSPADTAVEDPSVAVDPFDQLYLAWAGYYPAAGSVPQGHLWVTTSHDGVTWTSPHDILDVTNIPTVANGGGGIDKPVIAVGPAATDFMPYVVFCDFDGQFGLTGFYGIDLITGQQGGDSWNDSLEVDDLKRGAFRDLPSISFDSTGNAYVVWVETTDVNQIVPDQATGSSIVGSTFASIWSEKVAFVAGGAIPEPANFQVSPSGESVVLDVPKVVAEPDDSQLFVAYTTSTGTPNVTNIEVASSLVGDGSGWNSPVVVNQGLSDAANCSTNYHPALFLDSSGSLWVTWESNINGNGSVFYSVATEPQSLSFSPPAQLSDQPFLFNTQLGIPSSLGGYQALFGNNGELFSLWSGAPNATPGLFPPSHVFLQQAALP
jgi:hypothetical protein